MDEVCKDILIGVDKHMKDKIIGFFREYVFGLSLLIFIMGLVILFLGFMHYFLMDFEPEFIANLDEWNFYLIIIGFIIFGIGLWYFYTYYKNKKIFFKQVISSKRSEFIKIHSDLKNIVRHMPSKYQKMLQEKEKELKIK